MNWTKLKSNIFIAITILSVNGPDTLSARQVKRHFKITPVTTLQQSAKYQTLTEAYSIPEDTIKRSAEATMRMVTAHLPEQDPLLFNSYSAISHHRFRIAIDLSPKKEVLSPDDTINQNIHNNLYAAETLTVQRRLKPGFELSEKLSEKVEGKDNDFFLELASRLRDLSLFEPVINLLNTTYYSPFSITAPDHYIYSSRDSVTASGDSLELISFCPKTDNRLNGFTGTAVVDIKNSAIQKMNAHSMQNRPAEPLIVISQDFEQVKDSWLPSGKTIKVFFTGKDIDIQNQPFKEDNLLAECTTKIYQQQVNPPLTPGDFKTIQPQANNNSTQTADSSKNYFYIPFNQSDSLTLLKADSAIRADLRNQQTKMIRLLAEGKIPLGYFNLDYNKIFGYNLYEGIKLGIGGETSGQLSHHFTVGGYISYGLKDKSLRHGEWINIYPTGRSDLRIHLGYRDMNLEFGAPEFLETRSLLNPESYRTLLIKNMYATKRVTTGLEFRPFNALNIYLFGDRSDNHARQNTSFLILHTFRPFSVTRAGLQLRYSPGLKSKTEDGRLNEMAAPKSDYYLTLTQGLSILGGEYRYTKLELKGKFDLPFSVIGTTTVMLRGGTMTQNGPITELFNGYGSFAGTFSLAAPFSFGTMQLNEFAAANYSAIHLRHDFSPWLFSGKTKKKPALVFAQNIGIGRLNDQYLDQFNLQDFRKGFYESGLEANNLLRMDFLSLGAGIYYRYGPYQFSSAHDNFAYKFGFLLKL